MNRFRSGLLRCLALATFALLGLQRPAQAQLPGAIFTTVANGTEVNFNIYPSKDAVYLNGGPPPGAPQTAAGLPDGTYVFQVTDPSGKTLLSQDIANCRQFIVASGIITGVVNVGGCQHLTGFSVDHNAITVQLMPYADTPNNGGEYKAWATPLANYLAGCATLGVANGLSVVDCGTTGGDVHGFIPAHSKTDNFKVRNTQIHREIDAAFRDGQGNLTLGVCETWIDTLGVSNTRCSELNPAIGNPGFAHVENVENGVHFFVITAQPGCSTINFIDLYFPDGTVQHLQPGAQTVEIHVTPSFKSGTILIDVSCGS
jgi:hypothetical protein